MRESTALDQMICFQLYAASRAMTAIYRPHLDPHGLTYPQYLVLRILWHDGPTTIRDLGRTLKLDSGTLSPLLKRLETQGHIQRVRATHDERTVWIHPTDTGLRLQTAIGDLSHALVCATGLTEAELTQLHTLLHRARSAGNTTPPEEPT
ncbi:MarR family winged helix-turn-helix transcriptional regulator [Actinoplanes derwentensis]|uniref:DNA-binding transcriptional regulator, MarR family n=1 Tax=Actinoplanes derwentensis TaxID=113562 RepID=A0A1H1WGE8_9ACTN|nr:MarR family transcriptional regulator [Actinoplanes derwentensis]SDS96183.1 DNA-binding transcriptional regulator, MarR family [Actinoplanes derwentensis]